MILTRLLRRAAARRRARAMRAKTATARRVNAATDAMLTRHHHTHGRRNH